MPQCFMGIAILKPCATLCCHFEEVISAVHVGSLSLSLSLSLSIYIYIYIIYIYIRAHIIHKVDVL